MIASQAIHPSSILGIRTKIIFLFLAIFLFKFLIKYVKLLEKMNNHHILDGLEEMLTKSQKD